MTEDGAYRLATGQERSWADELADAGVRAARDKRVKENGFLTEDDIRAFLVQHGASDHLFPFRIEPEGSPVPGPGVVIGPVPWELPGGRYLGFWFSFGAPHEDPQLAWKPVWRRMAGPVTLDELRDLAKEQK